jgi:hypothetical protein
LRMVTEIGALDPWLYSDRIQGQRMSSGLNLASWSGFAGYCGLFAGAALLRRVSRATIYAWVAIGVFILVLTSLSTISRYTASLSQSPAAAKPAKPSTR